MTFNKCIAKEDKIMNSGVTALHIFKHQIYYYYVGYDYIYKSDYYMIFDSPNATYGVVFTQKDFQNYFEIIKE